MKIIKNLKNDDASIMLEMASLFAGFDPEKRKKLICFGFQIRHIRSSKAKNSRSKESIESFDLRSVFLLNWASLAPENVRSNQAAW